ncbi:MAG: hypothetical protein ACRDIU_00370 [Actinomycetota bacterium]
MGAAEELRDPWALVAAGLAGGFAWAVGVPVAAAVGIGGIVLGVKAAAGAIINRGSASTGPESSDRRVGRWIRRAESAVASLGKMATDLGAGPLGERAKSIAGKATTVVETMRRLSRQVGSVDAALKKINAAALAAEEQRLAADVDAAGSAELRSEVGRSLDSVRKQLEVHQRLGNARATLMAKMESGTLGLEALVAGLAEISALKETGVSAMEGEHRAEALADEIEGLRAGLVETEELSRRALSAFASDAPSGDAFAEPMQQDRARRNRRTSTGSGGRGRLPRK